MATTERRPNRRHSNHDPAIGDRMKQARLAAGISQRELCNGIPYTAAYVSRIEGGERTPSVTAMRFFVAKLGVTLTWLETGKDTVEVQMPRSEAYYLMREFEAGAWDAAPTQRDELLDALRDALNIPAPYNPRPAWLP